MSGQAQVVTRENLERVIATILEDRVGTEVAKLIEEQHARAATPPTWFADFQRAMGQTVSAAPSGPPAYARLSEADRRGLEVGAIMRAMARTRLDGGGPDYTLRVLESWGHKDLAGRVEEGRQKAMAAGDPLAGGVFLPEEMAQDVIELLRPATAVRRLNPAVVPMAVGTMRIPKITAGSSASYIGENANITPSQLGTGQLTLTWKKLAAMVPVSNDLVRYNSVGADTIVRGDIVRSMAQRENQAFLRDNGAATPKGLRYWAAPANVFFANSSVSLANTTTDLGKIILKLEEANVPMTRPGWIFAPRTKQYLMTVQTTTGAFAFRDEMMRGTLWGWPYATTTQVPTNLTDAGGTTESEIYLADFDDVVIGEAQRLILDASTEAAYWDGSNVVAAYSQDQTVMRCIAEHDLGVRRDVAVAVMIGVTWGA